MFRSFNGASPVAFFELFRSYLGQFVESRREVLGTRLKSLLIRLVFEAVPGTDILTDITAEDPVVQIRAYSLGQFGVFQLYSGVGDAASRIDNVRGDDSVRRTRIYTA